MVPIQHLIMLYCLLAGAMDEMKILLCNVIEGKTTEWKIDCTQIIRNY